MVCNGKECQNFLEPMVYEAKSSYYYDDDYDKQGCIRSCYQDTLYASVGCYDPRYPRPALKNMLDTSDPRISFPSCALQQREELCI